MERIAFMKYTVCVFFHSHSKLQDSMRRGRVSALLLSTTSIAVEFFWKIFNGFQPFIMFAPWQMFDCVLSTPLASLSCIYYQESPTAIDKEKGKQNISTFEMCFLIFMFWTSTVFSQVGQIRYSLLEVKYRVCPSLTTTSDCFTQPSTAQQSKV